MSIKTPEIQKGGDTGDISLLFFLAGANFWAILGNFWAILAILGHFWAILGHFGLFLGHFLVLFLFGQKCIFAIFITFCISVIFPQSFFLPTPPQYVPFPFYPRRASANKDN